MSASRRRVASTAIASRFITKSPSIFSGQEGRVSRSASRMRRFTRLRSTAVLKIFAEATMPNFVEVEVARNRNVKNASKTGRPFCDRRAKSRALRNRSGLGSIYARDARKNEGVLVYFDFFARRRAVVVAMAMTRRPFARRRERTSRPLRVRMRAKKP